MTIRVLFVCLGNICRSPMAEAVFQKLVDEAGLSADFEVAIEEGATVIRVGQALFGARAY